MLVIGFLITTSMWSQSIEEAKKHIYYERFETAKNVLQSVIAKGNASPDAWYWLGEIYLEQKKIDSAQKVLMEGEAYFLRNNYSRKAFPLLSIGWAHSLLASGNSTDARTQMEAILTDTKYKDAEALLAVARANIDTKNGDAAWAIELLNRAAKRDKKNAGIFVELGDAYRKLIDASKAIVSYDKALEVNPAFAEAMYKKGRIYKSQKNAEIYVDRFTKAYMIDSLYTPVLYELYYHYYNRNVAKADKFLKAYLRNADPSPVQAYMLADNYFISKKYQEAIQEANKIINTEKDSAAPRLYKLIAYSYAELGDSAAALTNMDLYFKKQNPSDCLAKDFELKAKLVEKLNPDKTASIEWYKKALATEKEMEGKLSYMLTLADLQNKLGNSEREAIWREEVYTAKDRPTNVDIYKWGIALYSDSNYVKADSVFSIYTTKYPEQMHGYLWRARCNALLDTTMEKGLAVPHYLMLIEIASKDMVKNKAVLSRAYQYLGAYEANITKDFSASLGYYEKILELNPDDIDTSRNIELLNKWIEERTVSK